MLSRSAFALRRLAVSPVAKPMATRAFSQAIARRQDVKADVKSEIPVGMKTYNEIKSEADLIGPGAKAGEVPTDLEQATGLERLEILGKMEGVDIFHRAGLDTSRMGTMENPVEALSAGEEQYLGCTGHPSGSHNVKWVTVSKDRPIGRCIECGNVYKMKYIGPEDDGHGHHDHHGYVEPKTMEHFVKADYKW